MTRLREPYPKEVSTITLPSKGECPRLRGKTGKRQIEICKNCTRKRCYHDSAEERRLSEIMAARGRLGGRPRKNWQHQAHEAQKKTKEVLDTSGDLRVLKGLWRGRRSSDLENTEAGGCVTTTAPGQRG